MKISIMMIAFTIIKLIVSQSNPSQNDKHVFLC